MNNEILLPNRCHDFAKTRLLRLYSRESALAKSFPLNRSRGFIRNIEHYAVNVGRFGNNSVADCAEQVIGELCKLDRHCIGRSYRANADCVVIGALIAHNTD